MRLPSHDRWLALGGVVATVGVLLIGGQFTFMAVDGRMGFISALSIVGIAVCAVGLVSVGVGVFMTDSDNRSTASAGGEEQQHERIGYRVRGKVQSRNARIRNQDIAVHVYETGEFSDENTEIE